MPKASSGHVAICTLVDSATGFEILRQVLDKTSRVESYTYFIPYFGVPKVLITDRGKENKNSEIAQQTLQYPTYFFFNRSPRLA